MIRGCRPSFRSTTDRLHTESLKTRWRRADERRGWHRLAVGVAYDVFVGLLCGTRTGGTTAELFSRKISPGRIWIRNFVYLPLATSEKPSRCCASVDMR